MSTVTKLPKRKVNTPSSTAAGSDSRAMLKGQQTKQTIVDAAMGLATQIGLEGLSIGAVAEITHMSKSGVFAHFGSREELQISVVREYFQQFDTRCFTRRWQRRGLPRVQALFANWMTRVAVEIQSGCIFISGAVDFDDRPGPVRDAWQVRLNLAHALSRVRCSRPREGHLRRRRRATKWLLRFTA
jgi:AcrR family transcriptional regulator